MECKWTMTLYEIDSAIELIETLWNVNLVGWIHDYSSPSGINRNIVECKCLSPQACASTSFWELIETLWNVNIWSIVVILWSGAELIETLWNVNQKRIVFHKHRFSN